MLAARDVTGLAAATGSACHRSLLHTACCPVDSTMSECGAIARTTAEASARQRDHATATTLTRAALVRFALLCSARRRPCTRSAASNERIERMMMHAPRICCRRRSIRGLTPALCVPPPRLLSFVDRAARLLAASRRFSRCTPRRPASHSQHCHQDQQPARS